MRDVRRNDRQDEYLIMRMPNGGSRARTPVPKSGSVGAARIGLRHPVAVLDHVQYLVCILRRKFRKVLVMIAGDHKFMSADPGLRFINAVGKRHRASLCMDQGRIFVWNEHHTPM